MSRRTKISEVFQFCPWEQFDASWYAGMHMRHLSPDEPGDPEGHYRLIGVAAGLGPNPYFDEAWYLQRYPDVRARVRRGVFASGFEHYRQVGHRNHDPHWLFSEGLYSGRRGDLPEEALTALGLRNGYHHYLIAGQNENISGSPFFDAAVFADSTAIADRPFSALALTPELATLRISQYFDPEWYLVMHDEVAPQIEARRYTSALHHYLTNPEPYRFQGSADFDEGYYRAANPDVAAAIDRGGLRNGYEHFLTAGRFEDRQPSPWFEPAYYRTHRRVIADLAKGISPTPFDHYLAFGRELGLPAVRPHHLLPFHDDAAAEAAAKAGFARMAHLHATAVLTAAPDARPVRFSQTGDGDPEGERPDVSVVIAAHNQFDLTVQTLLSLSGSIGVSFEVILIDNASTDEVRRLETHVPGLRVLRNSSNLGFLHATNQGIEAARGRHVLLLNNDVVLPPTALALALRRLDVDATVGAVAAKVVRTHGALQEAGSMLFRDGSALGYGRGCDPSAPEYNFVRDVDYGSGVFLMVRGETLRTLGGLDPAFAPAYYEDTDLCVRIWRAGLRVVYDPAVSLVHLEYGSSRNPTAPLVQMRRNRDRFTARHGAWLASRPKPEPGAALEGRIASSAAQRPRRVLFIEDVIPYRHLGSGFVRSSDVVASLVSLGWQVTVFPMNPLAQMPANRRTGFHETVELLWDHDITTAARVFAEREVMYDVVWVCRAHNLHRLAGVLGGDWGPLRRAHVVLDTEALASNREAAQALLEGRLADGTALLRQELSLAGLARDVIAVNAAEAAQMRALGHKRARVLGHAITPTPGAAGFADRADILALGSLYGTNTPNFDGLRWFIDAVWPLVRPHLPEVRLLVAGFVAEDLAVADLLDAPGVVHLGFVEDAAELYGQARLFLAPTRFSAGIPYKVHEAAAHGLPVVCTPLLAGQLGWRHGAEVLAPEPEDAQGFADAIVSAYRDPEIWQGLRARALASVARDCSRESFSAMISRIIDDRTAGSV